MRTVFNFNAGWELKICQSFNCFVGRSDYIDESFVSSCFELFAGVLIFMNCAKDGYNFLFGG